MGLGLGPQNEARSDLVRRRAWVVRVRVRARVEIPIRAGVRKTLRLGLRARIGFRLGLG